MRISDWSSDVCSSDLDLDEPVRERVPDPAFNTPHNAAITWRHLLQQTSEWEGELWGKPAMVDRNRDLTTDVANPENGKARPRQAQGTHWAYTHVRVICRASCRARG